MLPPKGNEPLTKNNNQESAVSFMPKKWIYTGQENITDKAALRKIRRNEISSRDKAQDSHKRKWVWKGSDCILNENPLPKISNSSTERKQGNGFDEIRWIISPSPQKKHSKKKSNSKKQ